MLKPGDPAPPFDLPCAAYGKISRLKLASISSEMVVLFFYPHDFSFICPTEVVGFNRALKDFTAEKTAVVAASIDSADCHLRWAKELGGIDYPMIADAEGKLARAFGIYDDAEQAAMRATFTLDAKRLVAFASACPINVGRSVSETLRIVQAIRSGQLCPAEWKPGMDFGPADRKY
jgi:peroxiredoxin 2/4